MKKPENEKAVDAPTNAATPRYQPTQADVQAFETYTWPGGKRQLPG